MGKLVRLEGRERGGKAASPEAGTAQIVLFTGVRYERGAPSAPDRPLGTATGTKRRRG